MKSTRYTLRLIAICFLFAVFSQQQNVTANEKLSPNSVEPPATGSAEDMDEQTVEQKLIEAVEALKNLSENRPIDGVTAVALLLMGSFVVDRFASGLLALFSLSRNWEKSFKNPASIPLENRRERTLAQAKLVAVYYVFAIIAAVGLLYLFRNIHIWKSLGFPKLTDQEDQIITAIVIVVGAERIAQWLQLPGSPGATSAQPVELSGNLTLVEPSQSDNKTE